MSTPTPFTVKLIRRGIPTDELLADVAAVARRLQTDRLSCNQYNALGQFSSTAITRRLGSWTTALKQLRLRPAHLFHVNHQLALADLRRVARKLHTSSPRLIDYRQHGQFTTDAIRKRFGPWHRALLTAGLIPIHYRSLTDEELFDNLKKVWQTLNRQPRMADLRPPLSKYTVGPYLTKFKTWTQALRAFDPQSPASFCRSTKPKPISTHINWRLRYKVLKQDHFRCRACGRSPATHPNLTLQIDHIHPRSQSGPSTLKNLQTLCNQCNSGKGDTTL